MVRSTSPASSKTFKCLEIVGWAERNRRPSSPASGFAGRQRVNHGPARAVRARNVRSRLDGKRIAI